MERNIYKIRKELFITNDEEIKEGDWVLLPSNEIYKMSNTDMIHYLSSESNFTKKIILTTDQDLIKDGVQSIPDDFLEWFIKNPSCERVEVEEYFRKLSRNSDGSVISVSVYKIIIPKEIGFKVENGKRTETFYQEPKQSIIKTEEDAKIFIEALENIPEPNEKLKKAFKDFHKQETLEEVAENYVDQKHKPSSGIPNKGIQNFYDCRNAFKDGAKWQQERMYSEKEVIRILIKAYEDIGKRKIPNPVVLASWFEKFKKK